MLNRFRFEVIAIFLLIIQLSLISIGYFLYASLESKLAATQTGLSSLAASGASVMNVSQDLIVSKKEPIKAEISTAESVKKNDSDFFDRFAPAVVKLVCSSDAGRRQGSGVLYKKDTGSYYVKTNLHVVLTGDGSLSRCDIMLYPNYADSTNYLTYKTNSYEFYDKKIDVAYLTPQLSNDDSHAGKIEDLARFALAEKKYPICGSIKIGEHLSVLGYPGVGGETLTITEGIVSGFEFTDNIRYIKTSAKIDQGNSGGLAVKDSGCAIGIPTFSQGGQLESIGRILDLNYISNVTIGENIQVSLKSPN